MNHKRILALSITSAMVLAACQQPAPAPSVTAPSGVSVSANPSTIAQGGSSVLTVLIGNTGGAAITSVTNSLGTACTATNATTYTCTVSPTATGNVTVTVTNSAGSTSAGTNITVTGTTPPPPPPPVGATSVSILPVIPVTGTQTSTNLTVTAVAGTGTTVKSIAVTFNGTTTTYSVANGQIPASQSAYGGIYSLPVPAGLADGSYPVQVTLTDSADKTASAATNLSVARQGVPVIIVPPLLPLDFIGSVAVRPVRGTFGPANPRVGFEDQTGLAGGGTGALSDPRDVVRVLGQALGDTNGNTYAKGFIKFAVKPTFTASEVDHVDYKIVETPDGAAIDYIDDTNTAGFESAPYDTSNHGDLEGKPLFVVAVVVYKTGLEETFIRPFIVDRTAPQAPDPEVKGAPVVQYTASNFLEDVFSNEDNWARGSVYNFITNSDLKDLPGTVGDGKAPSGLENVSYYYVPAVAIFGNQPYVCEIDATGATGLFATECFGPAIGGAPQQYPKQIYVISPATGGSTIVPLRGPAPVIGYTLPDEINIAVGDVARSAAIRRAAINPTSTPYTSAASNPLTKESKGTSTFPYRAIVGSGASAPIGTAAAQDFKIVQDNLFAVFAISRDRLGNSRPSTTYKFISFDNQGPVIVAGGAVDTSPLPFPAQAGYISDQGRISGLAISDGSNNPAFQGIGFATGGVGSINLGGFGFPITSPIFGLTQIGPFRFDFDSNQISDGVYNIGVGGVGGTLATDILGNPAQPFTGGPSVTIDNTDPTLDFTSPAEGSTFAAGTTVNIQSTPNDATAGLGFTSVFWNDFVSNDELFGGVPIAIARTRANGFIGAPVEIARGLDASGNLSNGSNARWNALYPGFDGSPLTGPQPMKLNALAVDKAGNATLQQRTVVVTPVPGTASAPSGSIPSIGQMDVHNFSEFPVYHFLGNANLRKGYTAADIVPGTINPETPVFENLAQYTAEVRVPGTSPDLNFEATPDTLDAEGVKFHRQFGTANWARIKLWQTTFDPSIDKDGNLRNKRLFEWTRADQDQVGFLAAIVPYYTSAAPEFTKVVNSLDLAYSNGNSLAVSANPIATVAPWTLFDNTQTSSTLHKVTSRFDTLPFNAPSVTTSNTNYVVSTGFAGPIGPVVGGNVRLYNFSVRNPSTTAVAVAVKDTAGNYNFAFEGMTYNAANPRIDGTAPQDK